MRWLLRCLAVLACVVLMPFLSRGSSDGCTVERVDYLGWEALRLSNGIITLHIVPSIGGRVMQLDLGGHSYFAIHPKWKGQVVPPAESQFGMTWKNYGGDKIWPAPQGWQRDDQWPGPPDPVFDAGPYTAEIVTATPEEVAVRLSSGPDEYTGLQMGRTIRIYRGSSRISVESFMKNISKRPVRWSIWEVTQLDTASAGDPRDYEKDFWAYCPINPDSMFPRGFNYMFGQVHHPSFSIDETGRLFRVHYRYLVGKVGLDSSAGWLAVVNRTRRFAFFESFEYVPEATYPDNASVEFWLHGPGDFINNQEVISMPPDPEVTPYLMESEILSPLVTLEPGEEYRFDLSWYVGRTGGPVVDVTPVGAVHEPLQVAGQGAEQTLMGKFAVFYEGQVTATFYSAAGTELATVVLSNVNPLEEFVLNKKLELPTAAYRVSLRLKDKENEIRGVLAEKVLIE
ncbi:MAG: DUF4380 domain-containing protein [Candidatus Zixiibacteriota bacterium]